ncbi:MAG: bifunctional adenosylcobinamide kinase/adenosylcobinamide-phosphate guanylyltransferase [Gammaproteobacteria bacterium]|jgi:hypothetical protein
MKRNILVIGGTRSGKTAHALSLANSLGAIDKVYIATCVPLDQDMHTRVNVHRRERGVVETVVGERLGLIDDMAGHTAPLTNEHFESRDCGFTHGPRVAPEIVSLEGGSPKIGVRSTLAMA